VAAKLDKQKITDVKQFGYFNIAKALLFFIKFERKGSLYPN
jgi:hypothetical protein